MGMEVKEVIAEIESYVKNLELRAEAGRQAIELLRDLYLGEGDGGPRYPGDRGRLNTKNIPVPLSLTKLGKKIGNKKSANVRGGKAPSSRFKGVKKSKKPYADGRDRFEVQYYDPQKKKLVYVGSFDNEYLAAAAYADRAGDKAEAARFRGLADENKSLNPDKSLLGKKKKRSYKSHKKPEMVYRCKHCGLKLEEKPESCPGCSSAAFDEIPK